MPTPEPGEIALAVLRAFATHGEFIGPNTVKYVPFEFWKSLAYIIDVKQVELLKPPKWDQGTGRYICEYRVFSHMTMGGNFDLDSSPQAAIMRNLFALMNNSEPHPIRTTLELTPSGWHSPELDQGVAINSFDILFKR